MKMMKCFPLAALVTSTAMISAPATAGEFDTSITTKLDACIKSVSLIGAQIKHKEVTRADGSPAFEFVVRSTGADYRVMCDAKTGVLGDVSPLTGNASG